MCKEILQQKSGDCLLGENKLRFYSNPLLTKKRVIYLSDFHVNDSNQQGDSK